MYVVVAIIVLILFLGGNFALFSGELFSGSGDNGVAVFFAICIIVADIVLIAIILNVVKEVHTVKITEKVKELTAKYSLNNIKTNTSALSLPFELNHSLINHEITFAVNSYKERVRPIYEKYMHIFNETKKILACNGCNSIKEKYLYLLANEEKLTELKNKGDSYYSQLSSYRIELLNEDCILLSKVKSAFHNLLDSEKNQSVKSVKNFLTDERPYELKLFKYSEKPCILLFEQCYFCLFSHVIFIFDKNGIFSTAIDPSALQINIKRIIFYEYELEFTLLNKKLAFFINSNATSNDFKEVMSNYTQRYNNRHDSIPELLMLVKQCGNKECAKIEQVIQAYESKADINNYFCKLISH